jgi:molybdopterin biosynthesis enzyme
MDSPITLTEALEKIKKLKRTYYFKRESENVSLNDSVGRELSEDIIAESYSIDGNLNKKTEART